MKFNKCNLTAIVLLLFCFDLTAQVDRTKAPAAGAARPFVMGEFYQYSLDNGLKIILVENHKLPRVTFQLIVEHPPLLEGSKAGMSSIAGELIGKGTTSKNRETLDNEIDQLGATFSTSDNTIYISGLSNYKSKLFNIFSDVALHPVFDNDEFEKIKKQTISGIAQSKENPASIAANVSNALNYGLTHPYGEIVTDETIGNIELEDCKRFYKENFSPSVGYLIVVGDITKSETKKLVKKAFQDWKNVNVKKADFIAPKTPLQNEIAIVNKAGAVQTQITIGYPISNYPASADAPKLALLNAILGGGSFNSRLIQSIREGKGWTYTISSNFEVDDLIGSFTIRTPVRTEVTDSAVMEILRQLTILKTDLVSDSELEIAKNTIAGQFGRSLESPQTLARFAKQIAKYNLPSDYYESYLQKVKGVTREELLETAKKYLLPANCNIVLVGNARQLAKSMAPLGNLQFYDVSCKKVPAPKAELPSGLTTEMVFKNHIQAIGGETVIRAVKNYFIEIKAEMPQGEISMVNAFEGKDKFLMKMSFMGQIMQKTVITGKEGNTIERGKSRKLSYEEMEEIKSTQNICEELSYLDNHFKATLVGVETFNSQEYVGVEIVYPNSKRAIRYYDLKSGLLYKAVATDGNNQIETQYADYRDVSGILIPFTSISSVIPAPLKVVDVKVNSTLAKDLFSL